MILRKASDWSLRPSLIQMHGLVPIASNIDAKFVGGQNSAAGVRGFREGVMAAVGQGCGSIIITR